MFCRQAHDALEWQSVLRQSAAADRWRFGLGETCALALDPLQSLDQHAESVHIAPTLAGRGLAQTMCGPPRDLSFDGLYPSTQARILSSAFRTQDSQCSLRLCRGAPAGAAPAAGPQRQAAAHLHAAPRRNVGAPVAAAAGRRQV